MISQADRDTRDWRVPILVFLAVGIGLVHRPAGEGRTPASYSINVDCGKSVVVRTEQSITVLRGQGQTPVTAKTACADIPPRLSLLFDQPMPINRADQTTLTMLPGVGPHLAQRIINTREKLGRLSGQEALTSVPGVGPKLTARLMPMICFD
jgi:predicted flap endonuclease-1-like 5' DNA nuclease